MLGNPIAGDDGNGDQGGGDHERHNVRLSVRMECCERDGVIAAEFFTVFQKLLFSRFPGAMIAGRHYDRDKHDADPDDDDACGDELIDTQ